MSGLYGNLKHLILEDEARAALAAFDRLAVLITDGASGLRATHVPIVVDDGLVHAHVSRGNPQWQDCPCDALLILPGVEAYISPGWYPSKARDGRQVPTWNYETVHVWGRLTTFDDRAHLIAHMEKLSARHEAQFAAPWTLEDAPEDYRDRLLGFIVGLELVPSRVEGKRKLSQEKGEDDRDGVLAGLSATGHPLDALMVQAMRERG